METQMLTTKDNPFDPFTQYESWYVYDTVHGYNTCAYLARIARTSDQMTDEENDAEVESAMNEIIANDPFDLYKIVTRSK